MSLFLDMIWPRSTKAEWLGHTLGRKNEQSKNKIKL